MSRSFVYKLFFCLILLSSTITEAKLPNIQSKDVQDISNTILKQHAVYKELTPELMKRSLSQFISILDPKKTYYLEEEVAPYLEASDELSEQVLKDFLKEDYSSFERLFDKVILNIKRHQRLEEELSVLPPTKIDINYNELLDLGFAKNEEDLRERLAIYNTLFLNILENLDKEDKELALGEKRKRELNKEADFLQQDPKLLKQLMYSTILKSIASSLDDNTQYFTPGEASRFLSDVQKRLFGIGIRFRDRLNGFSVEEVIPGGPASVQGLLEIGDRIVAVNSIPVVGFSSTEVAEIITGEENTDVNITIIRVQKTSKGEKVEEKINMTMTRKEIVVEESRLESKSIPFANGNIAYVHLKSFYQDRNTSSAKDVQDAILKIKEDRPINGVILDLRNNTGGVLQVATQLAGLFLKKGVVAAIKNHDNNIQYLVNFNPEALWDGPLIVLTNPISISASEVVAQALQDYGRAIIVGDEYTFGKGSYQLPSMGRLGEGKINEKGELKVTEGLYYTVSGKSPQQIGVKADIIVPGAYSNIEIGERFSKYPLKNESINPLFDHDFSDYPPLYRMKIMYALRGKSQKIIDSYTKYLPILKENSKLRLENNKIYQKFLSKVNREEKDTDDENEEKINFIFYDFQLDEAVNILKDLITLEKT
jgi:carboxyl-terminal processing protease